jgi:hypothetical protein
MLTLLSKGKSRITTNPTLGKKTQTSAVSLFRAAAATMELGTSTWKVRITLLSRSPSLTKKVATSIPRLGVIKRMNSITTIMASKKMKRRKRNLKIAMAIKKNKNP